MVKGYVLLFEDNISLIEAFQRAFKRLGIYVEIARDERELVDTLWSKKIDIVFVDGDILPGQSFKVIWEIKEKYPSLPVVFLSSEELKWVRSRALEAGADIYFTKPVDYIILKEIIKKFIDSF